MTFAFNIDDVFQQVFGQDNDVLRYVVKDDPLGEDESIGHDRDVIFAAGWYLGEGALANFLAERSNPLNTQPLHPQQVHARRSAERRSARRHRVGELQQAVAAHQRREHARHPRRQARRGHLLRRVHARLRPPLRAIPACPSDFIAASLQAAVSRNASTCVLS